MRSVFTCPYANYVTILQRSLIFTLKFHQPRSQTPGKCPHQKEELNLKRQVESRQSGHQLLSIKTTTFYCVLRLCQTLISAFTDKAKQTQRNDNMTKIGKLKKHGLKSNRTTNRIHEPFFFFFFFEYRIFQNKCTSDNLQVLTANIFTCKQMFDVPPQPVS